MFRIKFVENIKALFMFKKLFFGKSWPL